MSEIIDSFLFGDIKAVYVLNDNKRAVLLLIPEECREPDLFSEKNCAVYNNSSLVHLQLSCHNSGMLSNSFKLSESLSRLKFTKQTVRHNRNGVTVITEERSADGYGIRHYLCHYNNESGFEAYTEFFNVSGAELELEYITSVSLDALSPFLNGSGGKQLYFHRFKAGWSMEGLHQVNSLSQLGLERAWTTSAESIKLGASGTRAVREYHPYGAVEDRENGIIWGAYLAHNSSWQMELTRVVDGVSLSIGLADSVTGLWSKKVADGDSFFTPAAMISVAAGGIAELSNRLLSMRHRAIDSFGEDGMGIVYNDFVTTWGHPSEENLLHTADILSRGKTKYFVMDAGWYKPRAAGDWNVNRELFPGGMKSYTAKIRGKGMIPGIWMEFECTESPCESFGTRFDSLKLKKNGRVVIGSVINGRKESFWDFRNPGTIEYLNDKVIGFLKKNGFGYLKVDYNASPGAGVDGDESPGENLRTHMNAVREFFIKIKREIPDIIIENCASGGCRLEPSMMDITAMSSASDTHEGYEGAVVAANLHYLTPPRQNQIWCTLKPEYSAERFSYVISQGFLGRLCWSGLIDGLSDTQLSEMFAAERFYETVSPIIKRGSSYIYRNAPCSFREPEGIQAVIRYSENLNSALVVVHAMQNAGELKFRLKGKYRIKQSLYNKTAEIADGCFSVGVMPDFSGNVYLLEAL